MKRAWEREKAKGKGVFILGGGTNLLIGDKGFPGLVIKPEFRTLTQNGEEIWAGSGVSMEHLLEFATLKKLSGLEWAGGLPGTVGGAIRGNAGAFGGEIKDNVRSVESATLSSKPTIARRTNEECRFGYRTSVFKERGGKEVILSAVFALKKGDRNRIREGIEEKIQYRKDRHPLEYPNIGSIFKNVDWCAVPQKHREVLRRIVKLDPVPVVPTAYLISEAGLKGISFGGAMISPKHPNFIVNVSNARAKDVEALIELVKTKVKKQFGVTLEEEVMYV